MAQRPLQNRDDFADSFVNTSQNTTNWIHEQTTGKVFTSDYALYWYDYLGGYDVVLAQLGWNRTETQDIALDRGAANLQGKDWGVIVTWKYNDSPYLENATEMYDQMHMAYEDGAKYIVVFNYSPNGNSTGLLQDEHFSAIQKFWNDTVQNKTVINGEVKLRQCWFYLRIMAGVCDLRKITFGEYGSQTLNHRKFGLHCKHVS